MKYDVTEVPLCSEGCDDKTRIKGRQKWRERKRKRALKFSCLPNIHVLFKKSGGGCANLCVGSMRRYFDGQCAIMYDLPAESPAAYAASVLVATDL